MFFKKVILYILGFTTLTLGFIGIFLPVLPTTPFLLLSLTCFAGCNKKVYDKVRNLKYVNEYVSAYQENQGVSPGTKRKSIAFLWCGLLLSAIIIKDLLVCIILLIIGIGVTSHILLLKTKTVG